MGRMYSAHGANEHCIQTVTEKSQGKRPLGKTRCRHEHNIKTYLMEMGRGLTWKKTTNNAVMWVVASCSLSIRSGGAYCLHLQGRTENDKPSQAGTQQY
jgi:hypothetical protein